MISNKRLNFVDRVMKGAAFWFAWLLLPILLWPPRNPDDHILIAAGIMEWVAISLFTAAMLV